MTSQAINAKHENVQDFLSLGEYDFYLEDLQKIRIFINFFLDKDTQDLIYAAIEARQFSYRFEVKKVHFSKKFYDILFEFTVRTVILKSVLQFDWLMAQSLEVVTWKMQRMAHPFALKEPLFAKQLVQVLLNLRPLLLLLFRNIHSPLRVVCVAKF